MEGESGNFVSIFWANLGSVGRCSVVGLILIGTYCSLVQFIIDTGLHHYYCIYSKVLQTSDKEGFCSVRFEACGWSAKINALFSLIDFVGKQVSTNYFR